MQWKFYHISCDVGLFASLLVNNIIIYKRWRLRCIATWSRPRRRTSGSGLQLRDPYNALSLPNFNKIWQCGVHL